MERPTYGEMLKLAWLLTWRQVAFLVPIYLVIGWVGPMVFDWPLPLPYQDLLQVGILLIWFCGIMPLIFNGLFKKQFRGFQVQFNRTH